MSYFDDLMARVQQSGSNAINNVDDWFDVNSNSSDPQIKVDPNAPNANRSALDIALGLFNTAASIAKPAAPAAATQNASPRPPPAVMASMPVWALPLLAVGAVYFLVKRG